MKWRGCPLKNEWEPSVDLLQEHGRSSGIERRRENVIKRRQEAKAANDRSIDTARARVLAKNRRALRIPTLTTRRRRFIRENATPRRKNRNVNRDESLDKR